MPLRSRTQASSVSITRCSIGLVTSTEPTAMPVPARTARRPLIAGPSLLLLIRLQQGTGLGGADVDGDVADAREAILRLRRMPVNAGRQRRLVRPHLGVELARSEAGVE